MSSPYESLTKTTNPRGIKVLGPCKPHGLSLSTGTTRAPTGAEALALTPILLDEIGAYLVTPPAWWGCAPARTSLRTARAPVLKEEAAGMGTLGGAQVQVGQQDVLLAQSARARTVPSGVQMNDSPAKVSDPSTPTRLHNPTK